jgi:hypothetical protein
VRARITILVTAFGVLAVGFGALLAAVVFQDDGYTRGQLCDNSLCLRLPADWDGRTESGSWSRLITAPFTLPGWVGQNKEGVIAIPRGRFVISLSHSDRGVLVGLPQATTLAVSPGRLRAEPTWMPPGDKSFINTNVTFHDRSVDVLVQFADPQPNQEQFGLVNRVLATLHPAPPPVPTH